MMSRTFLSFEKIWREQLNDQCLTSAELQDALERLPFRAYNLGGGHIFVGFPFPILSIRWQR